MSGGVVSCFVCFVFFFFLFVCFFVFLFVFFFKQKTAYEMCGRDWSSDVCSSDLPAETPLMPRLRLVAVPHKEVVSINSFSWQTDR